MGHPTSTRGYAVAIVVAGVGLLGANLTHLVTEGHWGSMLLGGAIPVLISLGVAGVGLWVWYREWAPAHASRLALWLAFGIVWMVVAGLGIVLYQLSEGVAPADRYHLLVMSATYGSIPAFVTGVYDIQRRERERALAERNEALRESRDFLHRVESIGDTGGWEIDLETDTVQWTEGGRRIHEFARDETVTVEEIVATYDPSDQQKIRTALDRCRTDGVAFDVEGQLQTSANRSLWVRLRGEREQSARGPVIRGVIQDITRHREREQRLTVLNRVLRHNIRNDLNVIAGNAELLHGELSRLDPETLFGADGDAVVAALEAAQAHSGDLDVDIRRVVALLELLEDFPVETLRSQATAIEAKSERIMSLAEKTQRFESVIDGEMVTEAVPLEPLLADLIGTYRERHPEVTIEAALEPVAALGDHDAVAVIFDEVIENAVNHQAPADATVTVEVAERDRSVSVRVADTGPGIPDYERRVLETGEETPLEHGSGVGLWIVNWLATRLDGAVTIRENDPTGTVVEVVLEKASEES